VGEYPTPSELLAAHRTMRKMTSASYSEATGPNDMPNPAGFLETAWGEWVEATRQIALACSWLTDAAGDPYDVAWNQMMDDEAGD
jgi:hypothetical protein